MKKTFWNKLTARGTRGKTRCAAAVLALAMTFSMGAPLALAAQPEESTAAVTETVSAQQETAMPTLQTETPELAAQAVAAAKSVAEGLQYVGVLCVEFFVLQDGSLVVNEIAPRPHNSGHYSQNACDVSQFELQVRTMARLPLTQPRQHSPAVMLNLLGDLWFAHGDAEQTPPWAEVLALPGTHLHLYGKRDAKRGRKMGHLNITAATPEAARATALKAAALLGIDAF